MADMVHMLPGWEETVCDAAYPQMESLREGIFFFMKSHVPVDTGRLSRSLYARLDKARGVIVAGSSGVPYAAHVEFGTRRMAAQSFIRSAVL